jgi:hypothetical protein
MKPSTVRGKIDALTAQARLTNGSKPPWAAVVAGLTQWLKLQESDYPTCECGHDKKDHREDIIDGTPYCLMREKYQDFPCDCREFIVRDPNLENAPKEDDIDWADLYTDK